MAYHSTSNVMVERQNRKILNHLRKLVWNISSSWHEWMPQVAASLRSSLHTSIGKTPYLIVFGQDKHLPYSVLIQKREPISNFDNYVKVRASNFQQIYEQVTKNIKTSKEKWNTQLCTVVEKYIGIGDVICVSPRHHYQIRSSLWGPVPYQWYWTQ